MWLWYSFLRTGRADIFRMAEAMTRHTGEVDCAHFGKFAGLGSRHNVRHWGDGAKEVRISQSLLRRYLYYLTTDERTGDLMNEVIDAGWIRSGSNGSSTSSTLAPRYPRRVRMTMPGRSARTVIDLNFPSSFAFVER
jgi:hypothetical protein